MNRPRFPQTWRQREVLTVLGIALISVLLWQQPALALLFYPFRLFNTFVHELSHGLAAVATGGTFHRFVVNADFTGTAWSAGGIHWMVISAGYVGSAVAGGLLTLLSAWRFPARKVLVGLGIALGLLCLVFVRNVFGIVSGLVLAGILCWAGRLVQPRWADRVLLLLAVQMMLNGLDSLFDLVQISSATHGAVSDAALMARATGVPALFWALLWSVLAIAILYGSLRLAYRQRPETPEPRPLTLSPD